MCAQAHSNTGSRLLSDVKLRRLGISDRLKRFFKMPSAVDAVMLGAQKFVHKLAANENGRSRDLP